MLDVSSWTDQALIANTLVLTAEAFDAGGKRGVSPAVTLGLDRVAPTGLLTTTATLSGTTVITDSPVISLTLTGFDATAGASQIALGRADWAWEGENLTREQVGGQPVGRVVSDATALNGSAMQAAVASDPAGSWSGADITLPAPHQYRAYFRVKAGDHTLATEVARLEVLGNGTLIGVHRLYGADFRATGLYQEFHVDFDYQAANPLIFRLTFQDAADIWLDRIMVTEYPIAYTPTPTYSQSNFRLKLIDGAGNISSDLLVLPTSQAAPNVYLPLIVKSAGRPDMN